jgi:hypothetical protein
MRTDDFWGIIEAGRVCAGDGKAFYGALSDFFGRPSGAQMARRLPLLSALSNQYKHMKRT